MVSGPNGAFEVRYLLPGDYVVQAALSGFRTERSTVTLRVGQLARLNFGLQVGNVGEVVDVEAQGLLLETQSGVTGNVVTTETLVNLPLSGRNFVTARQPHRRRGRVGRTLPRERRAQHVPAGVVRRRERDSTTAATTCSCSRRSTRSRSSRCSRPTTPRSTAGTPAPTCSCSSSPGTNSFRGAVFDYLRNDAMDARNFFAQAPSPKPQLDRHQFGGVIGGPVRRNQTFFMFSYEGVRETRETRRPDERAHRGDAARRFLGRPASTSAIR